jgi:hypothetical protein
MKKLILYKPKQLKRTIMSQTKKQQNNKHIL